MQAAIAAAALCQSLAPLRPPAVPLIAHDPYFSVWSMADRITDQNTRHWTGKPNTVGGLARIDGKTYRFIGAEPRQTPALEQTGLEVLPTRTIYTLGGGGVTLRLTFLTPALPADLDVLTRPLTYIVFDVSSADTRPHNVAVYFDAGADLVVNTPDEAVEWSRFTLDGQPVLRMGSRMQPVLAKKGDDLRIDWGYLYLAADNPEGVAQVAADRRAARAAFESSGQLPASDELGEARSPVLASVVDLGTSAAPRSRYLMIAYDDLYSIEYFERRLRPWWRRNGEGAADLLRAGRRDYPALAEKTRAFDNQLMTDLRRAGGEKYTRLAALAYRQALAAHKLVADIDGTALYFPKENFSNGCIGTVDVFYPSAPIFLLLQPKLLEAQLRPILDYARMPRWRFPFAPHDLGTYPQANGQVYGGGEKAEENQMPVEESGNMLILTAALARVQGNAAFAEKYWPELTKWAEYLREKGLDPENQLSTDDFAGHLAHNANLSIKAILALGAYGMLADMTGHKQGAALYRKTAQDFARKWIDLAADGDHYKLAFDKPGTWSQKYNLVWDRLLGLNLFSTEVARKEVAFYKTRQNRYGLPLDSRRDYTKLDWILWTATLAESPADFEAFIDPVYLWLNETPSRVPLTDWYSTLSGRQQGFQARSVVGGVFIKMLADPAVWKKWAAAGAQ